MTGLLTRLLLALLVLTAAMACGGSSADEATGGDRATDVAFVTELMHRDAALLNLLDVGVGRLDPSIAAASEQLRLDATARTEMSVDQLESWGETAPKTVRNHAFEHSSDQSDIPSLEGMPTGDDLQHLGQVPRAEFEAAFVALLRNSLEATRDLAVSHSADADAVATLARDAERSCDSALQAV
jgi:hypothetical protein